MMASRSTHPSPERIRHALKESTGAAELPLPVRAFAHVPIRSDTSRRAGPAGVAFNN